MNSARIFSLLIVIILINQPDLGQTLLLTLTWITMIFVSGFNMVLLSILGLVFVCTIVLLIFFLPEKFGYVILRIKTFLDPKAGDNFQSQKALEAIKQGGLTGQGMGEGILKDKVPEAHTDFLLAVIAEELGFIGVMVVVILFAWLVIRAFVIGRQAATRERFFPALVAQGIGVWIGIQAFINMGVNMGILPTKGLTLPLMSFGGSGIVANCIALAILSRIDWENRQLMKGYKI